MNENKKSICVIAFSPVARDARVLRQIKYLAPHYNLTVIGFGPPHASWAAMPNIVWKRIDKPADRPAELKKRPFNITAARIFSKETRGWKVFSFLIKRALHASMLTAGKVLPHFFERWYWSNFPRVLNMAIESGCDLIYANDWDTLPLAVTAAKKLRARVVFDAHEYAPLEHEQILLWRILFTPAIRYLIKKYAPSADATLTVVPAIAEKFKLEFGLNPVVIMNAPEKVTLPPKSTDFRNIHLIYHGIAGHARPLENMIRTVALCDSRYTLHLMLVGTHPNYLSHIKKFSNQVAPGRVVFEEPVPPEEIVRRIAEFDIGYCVLDPINYNTMISLPNKFFDAIAAGLPVCIGPLPSMEDIVKGYGLGCVSRTFEPTAVAETLNRLTTEQLRAMRAAAQNASEELNADIEMKKLIEIIDNLTNRDR